MFHCMKQTTHIPVTFQSSVIHVRTVVYQWMTISASRPGPPPHAPVTLPALFTASQCWESVHEPGPRGPLSVSWGGVGCWGEPRGRNTVCAVPGPPDLTVQPKHSRASVPSSSTPFIWLPPPSPAKGLSCWGCGGRTRVGRGWPSDFKDIDRRSSIVKGLIIHLATGTGRH